MCGSSPRVHYAFQDNLKKSAKLFSIDSSSGTICLDKALDFEAAETHQLIVTATDQNGQVGTCFVSIRVVDVNDNAPIFNPLDYNISIREGEIPSESLLTVAATDADQGIFGEISYTIANDNLPFRMEKKTGELFASGQLQRGSYDINVIAVDGNGAVSEHSATIHINVIARDAPSPAFSQSRYVIRTSEDILPGISIGTVQAVGKGRIRYSISSGNIGNQFIINPENGRITVARYLDADKSDTVLLNIQADLIGGGTNHTQVLIEIEDHNDNFPVFSSESVDVTIKEDQPLHEPFYVVHATDKDRKKNGEVTYSIISSHPSCSVMVQPSTGQLQLTGTIDYERIKFYRIRVKATDAGVPPKSANMTVLLHVSDVNDNLPEFDRDHYEAEIIENSPPMIEVLRVNATDKDSDENGMISYRITNGSDNFGIDEKIGSIFAKKELDRERKGEYNLTIVAEDKGYPTLSTSTTVLIRVLDVNDNAPSCSSVHTLVVPADADTKSTFGSIVISDPDSGENGTVSYRAQQTHQLFLVNTNGDVRLRRKITDVDPTDFRISIIASDNGRPRKSSVCHVPIKVTKGQTDIHLVEPFERTLRVPSNCTNVCRLRQIDATGVHKWLLQSSEISNCFSIHNGVLSLSSLPTALPPWNLVVVLSDKEGRQKMLTLKVLPPLSKNLRETVALPQTLPIGSKIAVIGDGTENGHYYYSISNKTEMFELDEITGTIYLSGRLKDHIGESVHNIYFRKNNIETEAMEDILIEFQISQNAEILPKFNKDVIEIDVIEDTLPDSIILSAFAYVPSDSNLTVSYYLHDPTDMFSIDRFTGDISLLSTLDWFEKPQYSLVVEARCGSLKSTQLINVNVIDINNNTPEISSDEIVYLWPDSSRKIHKIVATDRDNGLNSQLKFELSSNPHNLFTINSKTGDIFMEQFPDVDESLIVRVSDSGTTPLAIEQTLSLRIMNSSKRWHFFDRPEYIFNITDSADRGYLVGKITGKGESEIRPMSMPAGLSLIGNDLKLRNSLSNGIHRFSVLASSTSQEVDWASVTVAVTTVPDRPRISSASCGVVVVPENKGLKNFKRIIAQNVEKFMLQAPTPLFEIDSSTGELSSVELDRETKAEHFLVIVAEGFGQNDTCTVRVSVSDDNDSPPQFSASTAQLVIIDDAVKVGDSVIQLSALDLDKDENSHLVFELLEDPSMLFDLEPETGKLVYKRSFKVDQGEWMLKVRVSDQGNKHLSSDRFIRIRDERESSAGVKADEADPTFLRSSYVSDVDEGLERGQKIAQVQTTQRDSRITYSIVEGNMDGAFEIDSEGFVHTAQELDYEIRPKYELRIIGTGTFNGEISTMLDVKVNNINDNPPAFPRVVNRKILESVPIGSYISTVSANDVDNDSVIEYSFEIEDPRFQIDKYTGVIHTIAELDYEENPDISLKVIAFDGKFKTSGIIRVSLIDINDNSPVFNKPFYDVQVHPDAQPDEIILRVQATDKDSGDNGKLSYSLERHEEQFSISADGSVVLHSAMTMGSEYLITVTASDHGNPRLTSSVPIRITASYKKPSEQPQFPQKDYEFLISESQSIHTVFGNVSASYNNLFYRILDGDVANFFDIDRLGRLSLRAPVDREVREVFKFEVG
ncbi:unnamed protein product [Auanema sp. JU1783]|nr:unnamed protein product [Auanema sp. JU1783]